MPGKSDIYREKYLSQSDLDLNGYEDINTPPEPTTLDPYSGYNDSPSSTSTRAPPSSPCLPDTPRSRFRDIRCLTEVVHLRAIVPQDQRPTDQCTLSKFHKSEAMSLTNIFDLIPLDDAAEHILNNYNLLMRV